MRDDRAHTFYNAPIDDILYVVLRQLKRPLESHGFSLSDTEAKQLAVARVSGQPVDTPRLHTVLIAVVKESEAVLDQLGLTFTESLDTGMDQLAGWETTAEFLELANEKSNAELRITLASAMAVAYSGDKQFAPYLLHVTRGDYGDETAIVRRVLMFAAGIDPDTLNALEQAQQWLVETNE